MEKIITKIFKLLNTTLPTKLNSEAGFGGFEKPGTRKLAFTIAETLITLAIIGVIASLTLPGLMTRYQKIALDVSLKKEEGVIKEAVKISKSVNGKMEKWNWDLSEEDFVNKYIVPYLKIFKCDECWVAYKPFSFPFEQQAWAVPSPPVPDIPSSNSILMCLQSSTEVTDRENCWKSILGGETVSDFCAPLIDYCLERGTTPCTNNYDANCEKYKDMISSKLKETPNLKYSIVNGNFMGFAKNKSDKILYIYLDVNGQKRPNLYGQDKHIISVSASGVGRLGTYDF